MPFAAVTGLAVEAQIAQQNGLDAIATGGTAERTKKAVARLVAEGATGLLSFGICGGLDPAFSPGTLVLPRMVRSEAGDGHAVDRALHRALTAALGAVGHALSTGDILGTDVIAGTRERKAALYRRSGAVAIDMESHLAAAAAAAAKISFAALRAIADPAARGLPPVALLALDDAGRPEVGAVLRSLLARPGQLPAVLSLALDTRHALRSLRRAAGPLATVLKERVS
jgi:adenosylhomocysteine nucleosidase